MQTALSIKRRLELLLWISKSKTKEFLMHDFWLSAALTTLSLYIAGRCLSLIGQEGHAFTFIGFAHRTGKLPLVSRSAEKWLSSKRKSSKTREVLYFQPTEPLKNSSSTKQFFDNPERLIGSHLLVLKPWQDGEKGVLSLMYSYVLSITPKIFDLGKISERYTLVLEPTWSGYFDRAILSYEEYPTTVFVQAYEPYDFNLIKQFSPKLEPIKSGNNTWIDSETFKPDPTVKKIYDLTMIAAWADFKRHWAVFAALSKLKKQGKEISVLLAGYPGGRSQLEISDLANLYGVRDQITFVEKATPEEVNKLYNQSRIHLLWSRKEGFNRAVIESMLADVPVIMREGFNYGYHLPYINGQTGAYSTEAMLPETIIGILSKEKQYSPRKWVLDNISASNSAILLNEALKKDSISSGKKWTHDIVEKVNVQMGQRYTDEANRALFAADYDFIRSTIL